MMKLGTFRGKRKKTLPDQDVIIKYNEITDKDKNTNELYNYQKKQYTCINTYTQNNFELFDIKDEEFYYSEEEFDEFEIDHINDNLLINDFDLEINKVINTADNNNNINKLNNNKLYDSNAVDLSSIKLHTINTDDHQNSIFIDKSKFNGKYIYKTDCNFIPIEFESYSSLLNEENQEIISLIYPIKKINNKNLLYEEISPQQNINLPEKNAINFNFIENTPLLKKHTNFDKTKSTLGIMEFPRYRKGRDLKNVLAEWSSSFIAVFSGRDLIKKYQEINERFHINNNSEDMAMNMEYLNNINKLSKPVNKGYVHDFISCDAEMSGDCMVEQQIDFVI